MAAPSKMTLPGAIALLAVAAVLLYLERSGENAPAPVERTTKAQRGGDAAGAFDYFTLALSWSPTHCASPEGQNDAQQCAPRHGRPYGFILHGLWPQFEDGFPESCPMAERPFVPERVIDAMRDVMPSRGLVIHQYRKHGTCSGLAPDTYFEKARALFRSITVPDRFRSPTEAQFLSPGDVIDAFVDANPALKPDMMAVVCAGPGSRFRELRVCFTQDGAPTRCGRNEAQGKLCRTSRMHVPPLR